MYRSRTEPGVGAPEFPDAIREQAEDSWPFGWMVWTVKESLACAETTEDGGSSAVESPRLEQTFRIIESNQPGALSVGQQHGLALQRPDRAFAWADEDFSKSREHLNPLGTGIQPLPCMLLPRGCGVVSALLFPQPCSSPSRALPLILCQPAWTQMASKSVSQTLHN